MPRKPHDIAKIRRIMDVLVDNPDGVWLRMLSKTTKVPISTLHRYLDGVLKPFVDNMGPKMDGKFVGIRVIRLKEGIFRQLDRGMSVDDLIRTHTLYRNIE